MKHITKIAFLFSFSALIYVGCSSGGTNPPTPTPTVDSVSYKTSTNYTYTAYARDSTDKRTGSADTVTSLVLTTNQTYQYDADSGVGKNDVTIIENSHSASLTGASKDTSYIASKSGGNFWHYNFGLEGLTQYLNGSLGWVLQAKMNAKAGDKWVAKPATTVPLSVVQGNATVDVQATEGADTTIMVGTESVSVKHVVHTVTVSFLVYKIQSNIDTYVSAKYGVVATIRHSTSVNLAPYYTGKVPGSETVMTSHP